MKQFKVKVDNSVQSLDQVIDEHNLSTFYSQDFEIELPNSGINQQIKQYICTYDQMNNKSRNYIITIENCIWKDQLSIILTFTRDQIVREMSKSQKLAMEETKKIGIMIAQVTHDLKTPLNSMIQLCKFALASASITEIKNYLSMFLNNSQLLNLLVNDIQDYYQQRNKKLKLAIGCFNIYQLVKEVKDLLEYQINLKNLNLIIINEANEDDCNIISDKNRIKQILFNLINNAMKYTYKGQIVVKIQNDDQNLNLLKISVEDTGVGIPEEIKSNLFKLFGTYDHNGQNKYGVGLGLTICKLLVKQLGPLKQIFVDSQVGVGSTFSFFIYKQLMLSPTIKLRQKSIICNKLVLDNENNNISNDQSEQLEKKRNSIYNLQITSASQGLLNFINYQHQQLNILIVDDNIYNILSVEILLKQFSNIQIYKAFNGEEALDQIKLYYNQNNQNFQIIFTDLNMPIMNGQVLISKIREFETINLINHLSQIIVLSYFDSMQEQQQCIDAGADIIIEKPMSNDKLRSVINNFEIRK